MHKWSLDQAHTDQYNSLFICLCLVEKLLNENEDVCEFACKSEHCVLLCRGCTKALAIRHHGWSWQAQEAWLTSSSRWWIGAAGIWTVFMSCCWTPFQMPTTAPTSVTGSSWWERCAQHGGRHIHRYAHHKAWTLPEKWGTLGKIVREAKVGFSSLSSKFVCDDLIKDMTEEGKIPIM